MVSNHPAEAVNTNKPDNMLVVSKVVVSSVARRNSRIWTKTTRISAQDAPAAKIVAARIVN